ncbi:MAG: hypothetical protein ACTS11_09040, partial [Roseicyclus sp.]
MKAAARHMAALILGVLAAAQAVGQTTLLSDLTIVDVEQGTLAAGQSLLIRDGIIAEIGPDIAAPEAEIIDGAGGF